MALNLRRTPLAIALLVTSTSLIHCSPPVQPVDGGPEAGAGGYGAVQAIWNRSCAVGGASCHNAPTGKFPVLAAGMSHGNLVGMMSQEIAMPLVTPGNAARSFLMHKVEGTMDTLAECRAMGADCGTRMPMVGGAALSAAEIETIRSWINAGAPMQ